jgi:hypothetical protein
MAARPTLEAVALLGEFGFEFVAADQVGEPTPGRIADRLTDLIAALEDAQARGDLGAVQQATEKLKRLQQAIDVWSLLAGDLDDDSSTAETIPPLPPNAGGSTNVEGFDRAAAGPDREFRQATGQESRAAPVEPEKR